MNRRCFLGATATMLTAPWLARAATLVLRNPRIQRVRPTGATISWASAEPGTAAVVVVAPDGVERSIPARSIPFAAGQGGATTDSYAHWATVESLNPATEYRYTVRLDDRDVTPAGDFRFRTAGQGEFTFLAIGDTGTGSDAQRQLAEYLQGDPAALILHTGDLAYPTGTFASYDRKYFDFYQETMRRVPFFPVPGNHDYYGFGAEPYRALHDLPGVNAPENDQGRYYSFDWGDVHFICLDSNVPLEEAAAGNGEMLRWLEEDLAETEKFWRVAVFHHPPYAFGVNSGDPLAALVRTKIVPILERFQVPLVFSGHEHSYQRTVRLRGGAEAADGAVYLTTGGGGAELYTVDDSRLLTAGASKHHYLRAEVAGRKMTITAIDAQGQVFDRFVVEPGPRLRGHIVNAASGRQFIGRGGLISIYGWQFTPETLSTGGGDVRVLVGGVEAQVLAASAMQINAAVPAELRGAQRVEIVTPAGSAAADIYILPAAPAIFPDALIANGRTQVTEATPCRPGDRVTVYLTGVGHFDGPLNLRVAERPVKATIETDGGVPGVQRLHFDVPLDLRNGGQQLVVEAGGEWSNFVTLFVKA